MVERKKQLEQSVRESIIRKYNAGKNPKRISEELEINPNTVRSVINLYKSSGRILAKKDRTPRIKKIDGSACELLRAAIDEDVSVPLKNLKEKLMNEMSISASITTISNALDEMNYSFKRVVLIPEARNSQEQIERRFEYCGEYMLQDENNFIFIDEFGINCSTRVGYGRSIVGTSPRKEIRAIRSKNISVCAAIHKQGVISFKNNDAAFNGESFKTYLISLIESLRIKGITSGRIIMDNASIHKRSDQRIFLSDNGFELVFLPAYSPQLNPIEEVFSKWKHYVKTMNPRTNEELNVAIDSAANMITSEDCMQFYAHVRTFILKGIRREEF